MKTSLYCEQKELWPKSGQHILAQYNEHSIIVYQAYRPSIAHYAIEHQKFGGDFKYTRMSWIKPNFLWMMYRSGWATKEGQEHILAIEIPRSLFDKFLLTAIASTWNLHQFPTQEKWKAALSSSEVRLQWDPDHSPNGASLERRAIQIGLRGKMLEQFGSKAVISISDITDFVSEQREILLTKPSQLLTPLERIYHPELSRSAENVQLNKS